MDGESRAIPSYFHEYNYGSRGDILRPSHILPTVPTQTSSREVLVVGLLPGYLCGDFSRAICQEVRKQQLCCRPSNKPGIRQICLQVNAFPKPFPRITNLGWSDALSLIVPASMLLAGAPLWDTWIMWTWVLVVSSLYFGFQGLSAGHHHPDNFHEGDDLG